MLERRAKCTYTLLADTTHAWCLCMHEPPSGAPSPIPPYALHSRVTQDLIGCQVVWVGPIQG